MPRFYQPLPKLKQLDLATPLNLYTQRKHQKKLDEYQERELDMREKQLNASLSEIAARNTREEARLQIERNRVERENAESESRLETEKVRRTKALLEHKKAREDHIFSYADRLIKEVDITDEDGFIEQKNAIWRDLEAMIAEDYPEGVPPGNIAALKAWYDLMTPERIDELKQLDKKLGDKITLTSLDGQWKASVPYGSPEFKQMMLSGEYKIGESTVKTGKGGTELQKNIEYLLASKLATTREQAYDMAKMAVYDPVKFVDNYVERGMKAQEQNGIYPDDEGYRNQSAMAKQGKALLQEIRSMKKTEPEGKGKDEEKTSFKGREIVHPVTNEKITLTGDEPQIKTLEEFNELPENSFFIDMNTGKPKFKPPKKEEGEGKAGEAKAAEPKKSSSEITRDILDVKGEIKKLKEEYSNSESAGTKEAKAALQEALAPLEEKYRKLKDEFESVR